MNLKHLITLWFFLFAFIGSLSAQEETHNKSNEHMNRARFDDLVNHFDNPEREKWQKPDLVIEKLGNLSNKTIGDIGAGTGYFSFRLAKKAKKVIAIDVDERFVDYVKAKKEKEKVENVEARLVEYDNPKLSDNELDAIIIVNTYHHINNRIDYFKKCLKGLSDNGTLMIVDFKKDKDINFGPPHDHKISHEQVEEEIEKAGFKNISVDKTSLTYQYIIVAEK
jgi:2-polyprenyl-3-methyl-5-hydroxy-6-metoxy-1,4-benzoquinol methylase